MKVIAGGITAPLIRESPKEENQKADSHEGYMRLNSISILESVHHSY